MKCSLPSLFAVFVCLVTVLATKAAPLNPAEEKATFTLPPGFEIELVASESEGIGKFVTVDWDQHGRLWSMTALEYPLDGNENPERSKALFASRAKDKVLVWDRDPQSATGYTNTPRVFADGLAIPLGILPYKNGVYVQHGPDIVFLSDTNCDGKADKRDVILSGFGVQDSHLFPHQFTRAPGDWIWMAQGAFNYGKVKTTTGKQQQFDQTRMARFRYDGSDFEITSQGPCNIWGLVITGEGETWIQEANDYGYPAMPFHLYANYPGCSDAQWKSYAPEFPGTAPDFEMGGTGLSGLALSDKSSWPAAYADVMYVANPVTRKVQAIKIHRDGPRYKLQKLPDFMTSTDEMFRPVSIHFGPDGGLYIVDWYNKIISHNEVPRNHPDRDKTRGRIWRVKYKDQRLFTVPDFTKVSADELLSKLGCASLAQHHFAWQAIVDRQMFELAPRLKEIIDNQSEPAARRIGALWALEGLHKIDAPTVTPLLRDSNRNIRRESIRVVADLAIDSLGSIAPLVDDPDPEVRAEVIRTAAHFLPDSRAIGLCLEQARAPLTEPTGKSTHSGKTIKVREAYEREFERYLVRLFLEQHPTQLAAYLDSTNGQTLPLENRMLAYVSIDGREGALRVANAALELHRNFSEEEFLLLTRFATEPAIRQVLRDRLTNVATQVQTLDSLLKAHPALDTNLIEQIASAAKTLVKREATDRSRDLLIALAATFHATALEPEVVSILTQGKQIPERQLAAIKALREMSAPQFEIFRRFAIESKSGEAIQRESVVALASAKTDRAFETLIEIWPVLGQNLRKEAVDKLTSSEASSRALLNAINAGDIAKQELDAYALDKLKTILGNDPDVAALRKELAARPKPADTAAESKAKFDRIRQLAAEPGDVTKGKAIFARTCMVCHNVHGEGAHIGPTLNGAGAMDPESLLRSIVTPSAAVESGYYRFRVETKDNDLFEGLFVSQSDQEIVIRQPNTEDLHIARKNVKRAAFSKISIMPEGLLDALPANDVANLFAYLKTLK